ncbi:hypothetical protein [Rivularia sp. UHCC 0363]|uniref:hypothetical protein n=1 Tax=Rivularia sp. UHCC 0363 TaxID=3110244 RepID=UPI002B20E812|nr:hypothetical protein [Rivularia sp. UHCC 0363]MEA5596985.1 hypothetical protein [Rivularia sp. UHCC 0363]
MPKRVQRIKDSETKVKKISEKLKQKANNPKDLSLREFVESLKQQISEVIDAGYDYSEIAKIMKDEGITVAPSTIRSYLNTKKDNKNINSKKDSEQSNKTTSNTTTSQTSVEEVPHANDDSTLINNDEDNTANTSDE